jgi:hypothetical protein
MSQWGYFDIEAVPIGMGAGDVTDFIIGAALTPDREYLTFDDLHEMVEFLTSEKWCGKCWVCHNAEYDLKFIIPVLHSVIPEGTWADIVTQGLSARTIGMIYHPEGKRSRKDITFRDSFAVLPSSLKNLTKVFDTEHKKLDMDFDGHTFDPKLKEDMNYLEHDIRGLMEVCETYEEILRDVFNSTTKMTTGATAMNAWKSVSSRDEYVRYGKDEEDFFRQGYFGGHVFLTTINEIEDVVYIDFNSMYPSVMRLGVPYGKCSHMEGRDYPRLKDYPGFWKCHILCPETVKHPFIKYRDKYSSLAPYGEFETVITTMELKAAQEHGYDITVMEGYVFTNIIFPFNDFISQCEEMRMQYKGTPLEYVVKINQNSLYGKFGTKAEGDRYIVANINPAEIPLQCWVEDPVNGGYIRGLFKYHQIKEKEYMFPSWAAWITANARLKLMSAIWRFGEDNVFYGDTDSLVVSGEAFRKSGMTAGSKYGDFKIEHEFSKFVSKAPKHYRGVDNEGEVTRKSKGVPRRYMVSDDHEKSLNGNKVTVEIIMSNSLLSMIKNNTKQWKEGTRSYSSIINSDNWRVDENGRVINKTIKISGC